LGGADLRFNEPLHESGLDSQFLGNRPGRSGGVGTAKLISLAPWIALFVLSNAFMEELLFRGLVLGRYEPLIGKWLALDIV
jgi:membrane protease YdiL (CAAX protease family)